MANLPFSKVISFYNNYRKSNFNNYEDYVFFKLEKVFFLYIIYANFKN